MQGRSRLLFLAFLAVTTAGVLACAKDDPADDKLNDPAPIRRPAITGDDDDDPGGLPDPVTSSSGGSGAVDSAGCSELTASDFFASSLDDGLSIYGGTVTSGTGNTASLALLFVTDEARTEDLGSDVSRSYATCEYCTYVADSSERIYFQKSGELTVDPGSSIYDGTLRATLTDATYIEVDIDSATLETTPKTNGGCVHVAEADVVVEP